MMMRNVLFFVALLGVAAAVSHSPKSDKALGAGAHGPAVKTTLSQGAINYAVGVVVPIVEKDLASIKVPDIHQEVHTPVGKVDFDVTNVELAGLKLAGVTVDIVSNGIAFDVSGCTAGLSLDWDYKQKDWPHTRDHGSADADVAGLTVGATVVLGEAAGKPTIDVTNVQCDLPDLDIKLHGGASWLLDIFLKLFNKLIKDEIIKSVKKELGTEVNKVAAAALAKLPVDVKVGEWATVDVSLVDAPHCNKAYMAVGVKGEFYDAHTPAECPYAPPTMPDSASGDMLQVFVADYVLNSAGWVAFGTGKLDKVITADDLPPHFPIALNTKSFKLIIPKMYEMYPDAPLQVEAYLAEPPRATIAPDTGLSFGATMYMNVSAVVDAKPQPCFTLALQASLGGSVSVESAANATALAVKLTLLDVAFKQVDSNVGDFKLTLLDDILHILTEKAIVPIVNLLASHHPVPLPVFKGIEVIDPKISFEKDYLAIAASIKLAGAAEEEKDLFMEKHDAAFVAAPISVVGAETAQPEDPFLAKHDAAFVAAPITVDGGAEAGEEEKSAVQQAREAGRFHLVV